MKKRMNFTSTSEAPTVPHLRVPQREQPTQPTLRPRQQAPQIAPLTGLAALTADWRRLALLAFVAGAVFGLTVLGWYIWPVQWTEAPISELRHEDKVLILEMAQDLHSYDPESGRVLELTRRWGEVADGACFLMEQETDPVKQVQLYSLAHKASGGKGCIDQ